MPNVNIHAFLCIAEMEDKVQKILNLIKEDNEDEKDGNAVGNLKKKPLVD